MMSAIFEPPSSLYSNELTYPVQGDHLVRFYDDEKALSDAVTRFISMGIEAGEGVVVIATLKHRQSFEERLQLMGVNLEAAITRGQLIFKDAAEMLSEFMEKDVPDSGKFEEVARTLLQKMELTYPKIRAYGEMVNLLAMDRNLTGTIRLEELWNQLIDARPISLLCGYLISDFHKDLPPESYEEIVSVHSPSHEGLPQIGAGKEHESCREAILRLHRRSEALGRELAGRKKIETVLLEAIQRRDETFPIASHELKTPLTALRLQTQILKRAITDGNQTRLKTLQRSIEICEFQVDRMIKLIDQFSNVAQIRLGRVRLCYDRFDLRDFLYQAVDRFTDSVDFEKNRVLKNIISVHAESSIEGSWDKGCLEQILTNLLSNAVKFRNEKPIEVRLSKNTDNSKAILSIRDFGIGIAPENLKRIFWRFEKIRSKNNVNGLGLGLYIAHQIVEQLGGRIHVQSEIDQGSTFIVELPILSP